MTIEIIIGMKRQMLQPVKIKLILERGKGEWWGRVQMKENLHTTNARTPNLVKKNMLQLLNDLERVNSASVVFEMAYDITAFFETHPYLNISEVAQVAGINSALMRQYSSGVKHASRNRVQEIQRTVRSMGKELSKLTLYARE
jgi:hypothetical protein